LPKKKKREKWGKNKIMGKNFKNYLGGGFLVLFIGRERIEFLGKDLFKNEYGFR
jgi:hypothetical protein